MGEAHPVLRSAARGALPPWARAGEARRAHMVRVADLLEGWARRMGENEDQVVRWAAAGYLHDALRDAPAAELRGLLTSDMGEVPDALLHGPAVAAALRREGVEDEELLEAVAFHTVGSPRFRTLGKALYAADFLDPGRAFRPEWTARLRERMPDEIDTVVLEILQARIHHLIEGFRPVRPETMEFWNDSVRDRAWAGASEA